MQSPDGACVITYNGEIYNYKEIRRELEGKQRKFRTQTDTEVILHAYQEWGEDCLLRFNGMWSFALWDRNRQMLFCARDRFGVKPFYYALANNKFYFGSEIKQILQASGMERRANGRTVFNFLERGLSDYSEDTFYEGTQQLCGGQCLRLELTDPLRILVRRYWDLQLNPEPELGDQEAIREFRDRFENAVKLRLRSDVPVGACLSGGLDSSSIVCQARQLAPGTQFHSFSACFEQEALDEREFISAIVNATNGAGHSVFPRADSFWQTFRRVLYHQDEPVGSTNIYAQWCVMKSARQHGVPVVLGGQGGDETLCGYQKYRYFYFWHLLRKPDRRILRESLLWARNGTRSYWDLSDASRYFPSALRRSFSLVERVSPEEFRKDAPPAEPNIGSAESIAERQKMDVVYASLPALLHYEDRNSMAHSVESRLPFLDYKLVEFAVNCAPSLKLRDGWSKWILREALVGTLPEKVRQRKTKLGYDTPQAEWMRQGMTNGYRDVWEAPTLRMSRFLSAQKLAQEGRRFLRGDSGCLRPTPMFRALCLELWARVHDVN